MASCRPPRSPTGSAFESAALKRSTTCRDIRRDKLREVKEDGGYHPVTADGSTRRRRQRRRKLIHDARLRQHPCRAGLIPLLVDHAINERRAAARIATAGCAATCPGDGPLRRHPCPSARDRDQDRPHAPPMPWLPDATGSLHCRRLGRGDGNDAIGIRETLSTTVDGARQGWHLTSPRPQSDP